jgi:hypothetical protein
MELEIEGLSTMLRVWGGRLLIQKRLVADTGRCGSVYKDRMTRNAVEYTHSYDWELSLRIYGVGVVEWMVRVWEIWLGCG